jgi:hypothetical protein
MTRGLHPNSRKALETVMRGPHRRGGKFSPEAIERFRFLIRFRAWARIYWPEALERLA